MGSPDAEVPTCRSILRRARYSERISSETKGRVTCRQCKARPPKQSDTMSERLVLDFSEIGLDDMPNVGGKNASLGELFTRLRPKGVNVVDGFAITAYGFRCFVTDELTEKLREALGSIDPANASTLARAGDAARTAILATPLSEALRSEIQEGYDRLKARLGYSPLLAVRSSAIASFADQPETFLNVSGPEELLLAVRRWFASLYSDRALDYSIRNGLDHLQVALSVGVQPMVRSDGSSSGVIFTLDPESGFREVVVVSGSNGLCGSVVRDEWTLFKTTLQTASRPIIARRRGANETKAVFNSDGMGIKGDAVEADASAQFCLADSEVAMLAKWACLIERHYAERESEPLPVEIEWAKDGETGEIFILQVRPETVHFARKRVPATSCGLVDSIVNGLPREIHGLDFDHIPETRTHILMNVGDPGKAFSLAFLPNRGVGLVPIELIVSSQIGIHPMALCRYPALSDSFAVQAISERLGGEDAEEFFVRRLSEGVAQIAAAFYPKPVFVRTSDFKTNEYARLIGGAEFEPTEENRILGFRGASRYYDPRYADGFRLECKALQRVRDEMGLTNVKALIPFCRTVGEAARVIETMANNGLRQHENGLEVYCMCELPSNVLDADGFLEIFDGFSIGSNDLAQLTLGIDRDSSTVSHLFDERDFAVKSLIVMAIEAARRAGKPIGICGQAPSDYPDFTSWLVRHGIDSVSLNPDAILRMLEVVARAEEPVELDSHNFGGEALCGAQGGTANGR